MVDDPRHDTELKRHSSFLYSEANFKFTISSLILGASYICIYIYAFAVIDFELILSFSDTEIAMTACENCVVNL